MENPANHEWLKILASAGIGLFAGLVAEPIKSGIQTRVMVRIIYRVLHLELVRLERQFSMGSAIKGERALERAARDLAAFKTDAYNYYYETERGLFYSDPKLAKMRPVFEALKRFLNDPSEGTREFQDARAWGMGMVKDSITLRIFDEKLINKYRKSEDDYETMMMMAGIGELTEESIRPQPRTRRWAFLRGKSNRPSSNSRDGR